MTIGFTLSFLRMFQPTNAKGDPLFMVYLKIDGPCLMIEPIVRISRELVAVPAHARSIAELRQRHGDRFAYAVKVIRWR